MTVVFLCLGVVGLVMGLAARSLTAAMVGLSFGAVVIGLMTRSAVAGLIVLGYGVAGLSGLRQRRQRAEMLSRRGESLETLAGVAEDLRAGAAPQVLDLPDAELNSLAEAAARVSEQTGAGLASLLDRLEAQQRALSRVDSAAHAQAAGIRLTVLLLVLLPVGALLTGYAIGADPIRILLHTEAGSLCAAIGFALQLAGLAWSNRLAHPKVRQPHRELAFAADLSAAALHAGSPLDQALLAAGGVLPGAVGRQLLQVGHALRWGTSPEAAWNHFGEGRQARPVARLSLFARTEVARTPERRMGQAAMRASSSGAALAGALTRCADDLRVDAAHERQAAMQRAGVLLVLPLGLCFLPAFVLSGLVPVLLAVLSQVM